MKRFLPIMLAAVLSGLSAASAVAAPIVNGAVLGPDDGISIRLRIGNDTTSSVNIKSIQLDGNTAASFPLVWDGVGPSSGPDPFGQITFLNEDTRVLTIEFVTAFNPGETFNLGPMIILNDLTSDIVRVSSLLGVEVLFTFSDNTTALYEFIDDAIQGAGLILAPAGPATAVSEPATIALMLAGLAALGVSRRRRKA
jgi:hypothetical protein